MKLNYALFLTLFDFFSDNFLMFDQLRNFSFLEVEKLGLIIWI